MTLASDEMVAELVRGGPIVVALIVVGGLVWRAASPLLMKLMEAIGELSGNIKSMTVELSKTNVEIRLMSARIDVLERQVARVSPNGHDAGHGQTN